VRFFKRMRWALAIFAIISVWAVIQVLPFVPSSWAHPLWAETGEVLGMKLAGRISLAPEDSINGLSRLLTYIATGVLGYVLLQDASRARQFLKTLWITGCAICIYGLVVYVFDLNNILWFKKWAYIGDLTATFVNRNHFAIYAGMILAIGAALLMQSWRDTVAHVKSHQRIEAAKTWLVRTGMPQGVLLCLVLISIVLSHSRAGLVLSIAGVGAYFFFYQIYRRSYLWAGVIGMLAMLALAGTVVIAVQTSERFAFLFDDYSSISRGRVYTLTQRVIQDSPVLGYGLNGFEPEYRLYQKNMPEAFNKAHSDIMESLLDLGVPMGLLLWFAIILLITRLWHGITKRRRHGLFPALGMAITLMALAHAFVDFNLQTPGVAVTWAALFAVGLAQSWPQAEKHRSEKKPVAV
jgi:O-antigen ligase